MMRITIEIVPHGHEDEKYEILVARVVNTGGDLDIGDYQITVTNGEARFQVPPFFILGWQRGGGALILAQRALEGIRRLSNAALH